jgi:acetylornithine deacetylase/succinyl-diaminopimelate desuccinylase-like protein
MSEKKLGLTAVQYLEANFESALSDLVNLARIPSVSFEGFPKEEVERSANAVAELLKKAGLENVRLIRTGSAHPYVYGERLRAPGKPTLLLYAHHDVQPPGRREVWKTSPFEPTLMEGPGGMRLYGRGTADDKAGIVVHAAAIDAFLRTVGELPLNVKVVIEGEEETGSAHLSQFLRENRELVQADILVLTDTANFDCGHPALTVALRGMIAVDIELKALEHSLHSGMWGGPIPDPVQGLTRMIATLVDDRGQIAVPAIRSRVRELTEQDIEELRQLPDDEVGFRKASGMLPGVEFWRQGPSLLGQTWLFPSLTVTAIQASSRATPSNIINESAWARITLRLSEGFDPQETTQVLVDHLQSVIPWGMKAEIKKDWGSGAWSVKARGAVYDAAMNALSEGYGRQALKVGCGGSIPFVKPFAEALGGAPALLIGVEDPYTQAHSENESLLVSDLKKACVSQILLFEKLATLPENEWSKKSHSSEAKGNG